MKTNRLFLNLTRKRKQKIANAKSRKPSALGGSIAALVCATLLAGGNSSKAASLIWDGDANSANNNLTTLQGGLGGAGTWNNANLNWWAQALNAANGPADVVWNNANFDTAIFSGTAGGAITLTPDAMTAGGLTFLTGGYTTVLTGANTLTLAVAAGAPVITADANATIGTAAIAGILGSQGFIKNGGGTLTVVGTNTGLSGVITVNAGTLVSSTGGVTTTLTALGSGNIALNGGTLSILNNGPAANSAARCRPSFLRARFSSAKRDMRQIPVIDAGRPARAPNGDKRLVAPQTSVTKRARTGQSPRRFKFARPHVERRLSVRSA